MSKKMAKEEAYINWLDNTYKEKSREIIGDAIEGKLFDLSYRFKRKSMVETAIAIKDNDKKILGLDTNIKKQEERITALEDNRNKFATFLQDYKNSRDAIIKKYKNNSKGIFKNKDSKRELGMALAALDNEAGEKLQTLLNIKTPPKDILATCKNKINYYNEKIKAENKTLKSTREKREKLNKDTANKSEKLKELRTEFFNKEKEYKEEAREKIKTLKEKSITKILKLKPAKTAMNLKYLNLDAMEKFNTRANTYFFDHLNYEQIMQEQRAIFKGEDLIRKTRPSPYEGALEASKYQHSREGTLEDKEYRLKYLENHLKSIDDEYKGTQGVIYEKNDKNIEKFLQGVKEGKIQVPGDYHYLKPTMTSNEARAKMVAEINAIRKELGKEPINIPEKETVAKKELDMPKFEIKDLEREEIKIVQEIKKLQEADIRSITNEKIKEWQYYLEQSSLARHKSNEFPVAINNVENKINNVKNKINVVKNKINEIKSNIAENEKVGKATKELKRKTKELGKEKERLGQEKEKLGQEKKQLIEQYKEHEVNKMRWLKGTYKKFDNIKTELDAPNQIAKKLVELNTIREKLGKETFKNTDYNITRKGRRDLFQGNRDKIKETKENNLVYREGNLEAYKKAYKKEVSSKHATDSKVKRLEEKIAKNEQKLEKLKLRMSEQIQNATARANQANIGEAKKEQEIGARPKSPTSKKGEIAL